jgi:hypothetical protein
MASTAFVGPVLVVVGLLWSYAARLGDGASTDTPAGALVLLAIGAALIAVRLLRRR